MKFEVGDLVRLIATDWVGIVVGYDEQFPYPIVRWNTGRKTTILGEEYLEIL